MKKLVSLIVVVVAISSYASVEPSDPVVHAGQAGTNTVTNAQVRATSLPLSLELLHIGG